ncbi:formin-F-like [Heteronotia binoei]|uniref:formin-F-like n=1 Tax=Heteronotia binoei TaxID=13085 RepID=UPI00293086E7|nr:formin-F-like [Heteronotia binoei]
MKTFWYKKEHNDLFKPTNLLQDPQDFPNGGSQFNFVVYKYKHYRWQKRILQIDANTKTIFNIEKGIIKKQFPFSQVKSCAFSEGKRFRIGFHEHQDYELEAASMEEKNKITRLVSKIIQSQACGTSAEPCSSRPDACEVIHEGLLDLQTETATSIKWVKHFVQLRKQELSLHCIDQKKMGAAVPGVKTIDLSSGDAVVSKEDGAGAFSLHTKEAKYLFQIPFTVQNNKLEDICKLQNQWLMLLDRYCSVLKARSLAQDGASGIADGEVCNLNARKTGEASHLSVAPLAGTVDHVLPENCTFSATTEHSVVTGDTGAVPPSPKSPNFPPASTRTKVFHWDVIPQDKIQKSLWAFYHEGKRNIDVARLYDQFRIQDLPGFPGNGPLVTQHIMLDRKIAHNFNIFLKSFHIKPSQLKEKLYIIHEDSGGLSDEQITTLRRYQPTLKDREMYQSFKGSTSELHQVDQFMLEMCKIPNLSQRLDLLLAVRELPASMAELEPLIDQKIRACKQLQSSPKFVAVLEYISAMGNYLNEKSGKEKAQGFRLSSLTRLSLLRGKERSFTLLHALVEQIFLQDPDLAEFPQELTEFKALSGASIKGLSAEAEVLRKELESIIEGRRQIKLKIIKAGTLESQFYKELKDLIQKYEGDLCQLCRRCVEMKRAYHDILVKFGEPEDRDSEEFFGWISRFISEFQKVLQEFMS